MARQYTSPLCGAISETKASGRQWTMPLGGAINDTTAAGAPAGGRVMSSLAGSGGLASMGGIAGSGGGLAG